MLPKTFFLNYFHNIVCITQILQLKEISEIKLLFNVYNI